MTDDSYPGYVLAYTDPDGNPAFQPVSARHAGWPGVITAVPWQS